MIITKHGPAVSHTPATFLNASPIKHSPPIAAAYCGQESIESVNSSEEVSLPLTMRCDVNYLKPWKCQSCHFVFWTVL